MATVTNRIASGTVDTSNATSYASASFTPVATELLVVYVHAAGTVATAPTLTASANSITFTRMSTTANKNGAIDTSYIFVANQLVPGSPVAMTVTFNCSADASTGVIIAVAGVSGMTKTGTTAVRQIAAASGVLGGSAPATVFGAAALTTNPTLFGHFVTVTGGSTPPSGWTEQVDSSLATPTASGGYSSRDSGFTGTTITLGSTTNGFCSALSVELDSSSNDSSRPRNIRTANPATVRSFTR